MSDYVATIVALVVAYIAVQQHLLEKNKVRMEKYDRRFKVYAAINKVLQSISYTTTFETENLVGYFTDTAQARFLFGDDINNYLATFTYKVIDYRDARRIICLSDDREKRQKADAEQSELLAWFNEQPSIVIQKFQKYLNIS